jgi:hypothetical protein
MSRKCNGSWLKTLGEYVEETESPRHFWLWSGLFTLGSALQRRVWLPFGLDTIYPNLFVMIVAPPGWSRKGAPVGFAKDILEDVGLPVGIDSPTKRHLTKRLAALSETEQYFYKGFKRPQAPLALVSKELSSFLAVDPKNMIEAITDLYDSHKKWDYGTSGKGEDLLRNLCISCLFATTPDWIAKNLPEEAIGGGFTSRFLLVSGVDRYKEVPIPPLPPPELYKKLKIDLEMVAHLTGEFTWGEGAEELFIEWYGGIKAWADSVGDDRLYSSFSRAHVQAIKTAMCLHVAQKDDLVIERQDMAKAIALIKSTFATASEAFSSHGQSPLAVSLDKIIKQLKIFKTITTSRLLILNYRNVTKKGLMEILENLETMKLVRVEYCDKTKATFVYWIGKA